MEELIKFQTVSMKNRSDDGYFYMCKNIAPHIYTDQHWHTHNADDTFAMCYKCLDVGRHVRDKRKVAVLDGNNCCKFENSENAGVINIEVFFFIFLRIIEFDLKTLYY